MGELLSIVGSDFCVADALRVCALRRDRVRCPVISEPLKMGRSCVKMPVIPKL